MKKDGSGGSDIKSVSDMSSGIKSEPPSNATSSFEGASIFHESFSEYLKRRNSQISPLFRLSDEQINTLEKLEVEGAFRGTGGTCYQAPCFKKNR